MSSDAEESRRTTQPPPPGTRFVVVSTVLLSFVSLWRAAAIVLCDLGVSAYYAGGIAEQEKRTVEAWRSLSAPRAGLTVEVVPPEGDPPWTVTLAARGAE